MRTAIVALMLWFSGTAWAADVAPRAAADTRLTGTILEIKDVDSYSYLRLKTREGEKWAAVARTPLKKGAQVTIENAMVMTNFESKTLNRTFPTIVFGNLAGGSDMPSSPDMAKAHGGVAPKAADVPDVKVPKATGPDARTVADVFARSAELKDKSVVVRGKVVKYNAGIMGKNWLHLRDGSGSATDGSNDLLVTTTDSAQVGAIVAAKGMVRTDKDFGAGYTYKVLIEDAKLQP